MSPNEIAEHLFEAEHATRFGEIQTATQSSVSLRANVYATSRIICLKAHHDDGSGVDAQRCICSDANCLDRLAYRNRIVPICKKRSPSSRCAAEPSGKRQRQEQNAESSAAVAESPHCLPFEQHLFVTAQSSGSAAANLYYCMYILQSETKPARTYCGITNNRMRRIRQHNGELVGGAKQTRSDRPWRMVMVLNGFESKDDAQRFEWSMHHPRVRRLRKPHTGVDGRLNCMRQLLLEHAAWHGRFSDTPIHVATRRETMRGTTRQCRPLLTRCENDGESCEIQYLPSQLRLYQLAAINSGAAAARSVQCLAALPLATLELLACGNESLCGTTTRQTS